MLKQLNQRVFDFLNQGAKRNFFQRPTRRTLALFSCAWLAGSLLSVMAMTDLFTISPFKPRYAMLFSLLLASTASMARLVANYIHNRPSTTYR